MSDTSASLRPLADRCVEMADHHGQTPVLAVERGLYLAPAFYGALAVELHRAAQRTLRLEVLVDLERRASLWRARGARRRAEALHASLHPLLGGDIAVEARTLLSRPAGPLRPLAVGLANVGDPVPSWAAVLRLTCRPAHTDDVHLVLSAA